MCVCGCQTTQEVKIGQKRFCVNVLSSRHPFPSVCSANLPSLPLGQLRVAGWQAALLQVKGRWSVPKLHVFQGTCHPGQWGSVPGSLLGCPERWEWGGSGESQKGDVIFLSNHRAVRFPHTESWWTSSG